MTQISFLKYLTDGISFESKDAAQLKRIYFPLCGPHPASVKSAITPFLSGDIKRDRNHFLTKPASREDLTSPVRNFFIKLTDGPVITLSSKGDPKKSYVQAGPIWHRVVRTHTKAGIQFEAVNFVPAADDQCELMRVKITNVGTEKISFTPTAAISLFARAQANKHDHEHVTSLMHRISQVDQGVIVAPTLSFDEQGHRLANASYYVFGSDASGTSPIGSFPTIEEFCGEETSISHPRAVYENLAPRQCETDELNGKEAMGALRFKEGELAPNESKEYLMAIGVTDNTDQAAESFARISNADAFEQTLDDTKKYWEEKVNTISFNTGDADFNSWMHWVSLQPILRRIFGCSFLPDHDYGKGGKGWRDIWQDLLSLILIEPQEVRERLVNNFAGVRIDGSNATIIGHKPGEFIADRNHITRVWMDHGAWPFITLLLYIHQTGDFDILLEKVSFFRDPQFSRSIKRDHAWSPEYGNQLKDKKGKVHEATILEHILIQLLVQFFNVGEHNITRLENADWNDGLDMAFDRGESVAFMSLYGGNMLLCAYLLAAFSQRMNVKELTLSREVLQLLDSIGDKSMNYDDTKAKTKFLHDIYFASVQPEVSGAKIQVDIADVIQDLRQKGEWIRNHINTQETVSVDGNTWFNGYYDNQGKRVEGKEGNRIRMTLTGQVFPIMSGVAGESRVKNIAQSVDQYLKDPERGGFRLNSNFGVDSYLDLGRAFSFYYGTKENGAYFSHMTVMYAYALYARGFIKEGAEALQSIYRMCMDHKSSLIYPGIPEYFDSNGRGMYHYLTGSASWYLLTILTQGFGVRGDYGDLMLAPRLVKEQFDQSGRASVRCPFAGKTVEICYQKDIAADEDHNGLSIVSVLINGKKIPIQNANDYSVVIPRQTIINFPETLLKLSIKLQIRTIPVKP